jgi:thimet oligopeptidase
MMHEMLGATRMFKFSGLHTKRDFVEVPSQMFEQWFYETDVLKKISKHYKTGAVIPDALIVPLQQLIRFDIGDFVLRQSALSRLSLGLFSGIDKDIQAYYKQLMQSTRPYVLFDDTSHMPASFGHLVGYDAKYYSYLWSKVYAIDLFMTIKQHGLFSPAVGANFVHKILAKGGSVEPEQLMSDFLGRRPSMHAFLSYYGL